MPVASVPDTTLPMEIRYTQNEKALGHTKKEEKKKRKKRTSSPSIYCRCTGSQAAGTYWYMNFFLVPLPLLPFCHYTVTICTYIPKENYEELIFTILTGDTNCRFFENLFCLDNNFF